jgi:hypothetical protein
MASAAKVITIQEQGRDVTYRYVASTAELKKTGQLTRWVGDHDILLYEYEGQIKSAEVMGCPVIPKIEALSFSAIALIA